MNASEPAMRMPRKVDPSAWVIPSHRFRVEQIRHFAICVLAPAILTISGLIFLPTQAFSWHGAALWWVMWLLVGGLGVSVGFHRLFAHHAFQSHPSVKYLFGALGSMAAQGSVIYWTALHRRHHTFSDQVGDPHSPSRMARSPSKGGRIGSFLQGHIIWVLRHDVPKPSRYAKDLLADPIATALSKQYWLWVAIGILLPAIVGGVFWNGPAGFLYGAYWGGIVRLTIGHQIIWSINSLCHGIGYRAYETSDKSTNNAWLAIPSFGESWHNNHHQNATSARFGHRWYEIDIGWLLISAFEKLQLVKSRASPKSTE